MFFVFKNLRNLMKRSTPHSSPLRTPFSLPHRASFDALSASLQSGARLSPPRALCSKRKRRPPEKADGAGENP
jgi:hypothetical protein